MPILDNDNFFEATNMIETTSRPDLIFNEFKGRVKATLGEVKQFELDTPPGVVSNLDAYVIGPNPIGDWAGAAGMIVVWVNGWKYINPRPGFRLLVQEGIGEGRIIDYWSTGWSSFGGQQALTPFEVAPGVWEVDWYLKYGQLARLTLDQPTITLRKPIGFRYGREHWMIAVQDGAGGRDLVLKVGNYVRHAGVTHGASGLDIDKAPGAETLIEFIHPGPSYVGPLVRQIDKTIQAL